MITSTDTLGRPPIFKAGAFEEGPGSVERSDEWMGRHLIKTTHKPVEEMSQQKSHEHRRDQILRMHTGGQSRDEIAIELGLTRDYVRDCIGRAGISRKRDVGDKDAAVAAFRLFCNEKNVKAKDIRPNNKLGNPERAKNAALRIECIERVYMASRCPPSVLAQVLNLTRTNIQPYVTKFRRELEAQAEVGK